MLSHITCLIDFPVFGNPHFLMQIINFKHFPTQRYSLLSVSGTPDKWNFRLVEPISLVLWICINKPLLFYSDKWNPR